MGEEERRRRLGLSGVSAGVGHGHEGFREGLERFQGRVRSLEEDPTSPVQIELAVVYGDMTRAFSPRNPAQIAIVAKRVEAGGHQAGQAPELSDPQSEALRRIGSISEAVHVTGAEGIGEGEVEETALVPVVISGEPIEPESVERLVRRVGELQRRQKRDTRRRTGPSR